MKEARLQNPVLMNKNRILRRVSVEDEMARHIEVHFLYRITGYVDAAAIGGKSMQLPGEVSGATCSHAEKSAEAIVSNGNELRETEEKKKTGEASRITEGQNVKRLELYCNSRNTLKVVSECFVAFS